MTVNAVAFANNDIAYIWWRRAAKLPNCLGFSVHRIDSANHEEALPAFVGFKPGLPGQPHKLSNTDVWPIQSFQWKDVYAPPGTYRYRIVPMLGPDTEALQPDVANALLTNAVTISGDYGDLQAYFNVGLISTQAVARRLRKLVAAGLYPNRLDALKGEIARPGSEIRKTLAGDVLDKGVLALLARAGGSAKGSCKLALYELTDGELRDAIVVLAGKKRLALCLANADSTVQTTDAQGKTHTTKVKDGTNAAARAALKAKAVNLVDRFVPSSGIGHNKFVVYADAQGKNQRVLTGSTNWTATGLCSQTNNALLIRNAAIADGYRKYWDWLVWDAAQTPVQGKDLRDWDGAAPLQTDVDKGSVTVWFSPNTARKTKDETVTPPDLAEVFSLILAAQHGVLFLAFNPGTPSCLEVVRQKAEAMKAAGQPFYVRGAVTDPAPLGQFATFLTKRDATVAPDVLVSGVAGVPDDFSYWEQELYKIGHAVIHDKILVIDPFTPHCVVVTGSHNLGYKASYQNDENLVIVKGHRRLAAAYAAHVLDVTNHFAWRYKLSALQKQGRMAQAWGDLDDSDAWQNKYFGPVGDLSRDAFFFGP